MSESALQTTKPDNIFTWLGASNTPPQQEPLSNSPQGTHQ